MYGDVYRRFLPHINNPQDASVVLSEMAGELNVSHTGSGYRSPSANHIPTDGRLGLIYDLTYQGSGMKIDEVLLGGPLDLSQTQAKHGDIIVALNGQMIDEVGGVDRALKQKFGQVMVVRFYSPTRQEHWSERIQTISPQQEAQLLRHRWVAKKRKRVEQLSNGQLGYVYVPQMDEQAFRNLTAEAIGRYRFAKGLIIDIRFNKGGNLHDSILAFASGKKYAAVVPPHGGATSFEPRSRWWTKSAVIGNASSYSDGSVFPQAYSELELGPVVGDPIPGTGTAVWWFKSKVLPGLVYGFPQLPFRKLDGTYYENLQLEPDVLISNDVPSIIAVKDAGYISKLHWSPDGQSIAMAVDRGDSSNVYNLDLSTYDLHQLSWNAGNEYPLAFTADSKNIYINSPQLQNANYDFFSIAGGKMMNQVYSVPEAGGRLTPVLPFPVSHFSASPDGQYYAYAVQASIEQDYRKHQQSAASPSVFIYSTQDKNHHQISNEGISALNPIWSADGQTLYYLSEYSGDFNVWQYNRLDGSNTQVTWHKSHPVRDLSVAANGTVAYSWNGELYILNSDDHEPEKLDVFVRSASLDLDFFDMQPVITEFGVNASGSELVVAAWGDLFFYNLDSGTVRAMATTPYEERGAQFHPHKLGLVFGAEKNGKWGIYGAFPDDVDTFIDAENIIVEDILVGDFDAFQPLFSPDGTKIAYLRNRNSIHVYDLTTKEDWEVVSSQFNYSYKDGDTTFLWAPDSKHIVTTIADTGFNSEVTLFAIDGSGAPVRLTYNNSMDTPLGWSDDGGSVYLLSTELSQFAADGSQTSSDIFRIPLSRAAVSSNPQTDGYVTDLDESGDRMNLPVIDMASVETERLSILRSRITNNSANIIS
ncbi:tricorn protease homolog, partial [Elysia marginata]